MAITYDLVEKRVKLAGKMRNGESIRILNYHNTPFARKDDYEKHATKTGTD